MPKEIIPKTRGLSPQEVPGVPEQEGFAFSERSLKAMQGIHPDLRKVADRALKLTEINFVITEGKRTLEMQKKYVKEGKSQTMKSRHLGGKAIDFVDYPDFSYDVKKMTKIANAFKAAAKELNIPIRWGGDWKSFKDTSHIELYSGKYPD